MQFRSNNKMKTLIFNRKKYINNRTAQNFKAFKLKIKVYNKIIVILKLKLIRSRFKKLKVKFKFNTNKKNRNRINPVETEVMTYINQNLIILVSLHFLVIYKKKIKKTKSIFYSYPKK